MQVHSPEPPSVPAPWTAADVPHVRVARARCYQLIARLIEAGTEGQYLGEGANRLVRAHPLATYGIAPGDDEEAFRKAVTFAGFDADLEVALVRARAQGEVDRESGGGLRRVRFSDDPHDPLRWLLVERGDDDGLVTIAEETISSRMSTAQAVGVRGAVDVTGDEAHWLHRALGEVLGLRKAVPC